MDPLRGTLHVERPGSETGVTPGGLWTAGMSFVDEVVRAVGDRTPFGDPAVDRVTVGSDLVLVEVADRADGSPDAPERAAGVAHRPPGPVPPVPDGADALAVGEWARDPSRRSGEGDGSDDSGDRDSEGRTEWVGRALGLATLNALSAPLIDWQRGDPFESIDPGVGVIATVGLFRPAFRKFGDVTVRVIEREPVSPPETPTGVTVETYPVEERAAALSGVGVLFVTGSSLVYGGVENYLAAADRIPTVVLVGATASFLPDPAFAAGVTTLAGVEVTDPGAVRAGIQGGACGTDLHGEGLRKGYVTAGEDAPGLDLE